MHKWKTWLGVLLIFVSGTLTGSIGTYVYVRSKVGKLLSGDPKAVRVFLVKRLKRELRLNSTQEKKVAEIIEDTQAKLKKIRLKTGPESIAVMDGSLSQIDSILNSQQQKKFESFKSKTAKRWKNSFQ